MQALTIQHLHAKVGHLLIYSPTDEQVAELARSPARNTGPAPPTTPQPAAAQVTGSQPAAPTVASRATRTCADCPLTSYGLVFERAVCVATGSVASFSAAMKCTRTVANCDASRGGADLAAPQEAPRGARARAGGASPAKPLPRTAYKRKLCRVGPNYGPALGL